MTKQSAKDDWGGNETTDLTEAEWIAWAERRRVECRTGRKRDGQGKGEQAVKQEELGRGRDVDWGDANGKWKGKGNGKTSRQE